MLKKQAKANISKKRILMALAPLLVFNAVLAIDLVVSKNSAWSQIHDPYEWGDDDRLYTAKRSQEIKADGQYLFGYMGEDANCWNLKEKHLIDACLLRYPYGGQGTMVMGGNLVVSGAEALYMNKYDAKGMNWLMSTSSEPWGNALGTYYGTSTDTFYGNNLLADGTIRTGKIDFTAASSGVAFSEDTATYVDDHLFCKSDSVVFYNNEENALSNYLRVTDQDTCQRCTIALPDRPTVSACGIGEVGEGYRFLMSGNLDVKENLKVNEQIRICLRTAECEKACCRVAEYHVDPDVGNFVGNSCEQSPCAAEKADLLTCVGNMQIPDPDRKYCYPQPYEHAEYDEDEPDLESEYYKEDHVGGDIWFDEDRDYED